MTYNDQQKSLLKEYSKGELSLSQLLLKKYNPQFQNEEGNTLLHIAAHNFKSRDVIEILENNLIPINKTNSLGKTALHNACYRKDEKIINLLLKYNANPNLQDNRGNTPFMEVDGECEFITAEYILKNNIDLNIQNFSGTSVLYRWIEKLLTSPIKSIVNNKELCDKIDWLLTDNEGNNFFEAITFNYNYISDTKVNYEFEEFIFPYLLKFGVSLNNINNNGEKPLLRALYSMKLPLIDLLIKNKIDINSVNSNNDSLGACFDAFMIKEEKNKPQYLEAISKYIESNNLYQPTTNDIFKKLDHAISLKDLTKIKAIYQENVLKSSDKQYLLDHSLSQCLSLHDPKIQLSNFFIKIGANINSDVIHHNRSYYNGANVFLQALSSSSKESTKLIEYMMGHKYTINNICNNKKENALHYLIEKHYSRLNILEQNKVDINQQNSDGNTPLHTFFLSHNFTSISIAQYILEANPDINIKNNEGKSVYNSFTLWRDQQAPPFAPALQEIHLKMEQLYLEQNITASDNLKLKKHKI